VRVNAQGERLVLVAGERRQLFDRHTAGEHHAGVEVRLRVLADVAANANTPTADVVKRLQLPRKTVDRILQELHLLELLTLDSIAWGTSERWIYSLAEGVDRTALDSLAGNFTTRGESA